MKTELHSGKAHSPVEIKARDIYAAWERAGGEAYGCSGHRVCCEFREHFPQGKP